ncbi:DNA repair protein RecO [Legionella hackeliae]|uniref:DNA repair protein RecO n=1 Tax=Legionella hackeliae TaxID=449 RepID=A0A0A8UUJ7_LEGHA|nr:DNA repair protein RecO [Legionella hackeliae]KTD15459.1 DNA repair protein RecO [Legionella hackeliae]CEK11171.1 DNA repair protein recO [Legionella hackeliae]STX47936.1 DNA repair protein RecO [Legionella hackeliae]
MTVELVEAWVLHKRPSGDSSVLVTFFTREKGIIKCLCKGGRSPKKQAVLQLFTPLWLSVEIKRDRHYVRQFETTSRTLDLKGNALFAGLYLNELLYYSLSALDYHPELFETYLKTLNGLVDATNNLMIEVLLRHFEWSLLTACGQAISFTEEANTMQLIDENKNYQFIAKEGFIPAITGLSGKHILALSQGHLNDVAVLKTAKLIMRQAIDSLLEGRVLQSRALYIKKT